MQVRECVRGCVIPRSEDGFALMVPSITVDGGALCAACLGRIGWALDSLPDLAARTRALIVPDISTGGNEKVSGTKDPQLPFNIVAFEACDALAGVLANWVVYWARLIGRPGPAARSISVKDGPFEVAEIIRGHGEWLKAWLREIALHDFAADFHDAIVDAQRRAAARFPERRRVGQLKPRFCPICGDAAVWLEWHGDLPDVLCKQCGWHFETDWGELLEVVGIETGRGSGGRVGADA